MRFAHLVGAVLVCTTILACGDDTGTGGTSSTGSGDGGSSSNGDGGGSTNDGGGPASGGGGAGVSDSGVQLTVDGAVYNHTSNGLCCEDQANTWLVVTLTIANVSAGPSIDTGLTQYKFNQGGVLRSVDPNSEFLDGYCEDGLSLAEGGQLTCSVAFEVPFDLRGGTLQYEDRNSDATASASVPDFPEPTTNAEICWTFPGSDFCVSECLSRTDPNAAFDLNQCQNNCVETSGTRCCEDLNTTCSSPTIDACWDECAHPYVYE